MKTGILVIFLFLFNYSFSQNLVPNPSFEQYSNCPRWPDDLNFAVPWFQPNTNGGSTDYFNICNLNTVSVPNNWIGKQNARTGVAYAGFGPINYPLDPPPRGAEYLEVKLNSPLSGEKKYVVSFYVSSGDKAMYAVDAIGAYFSKTVVYSTDYKILSQYHPQIENTKGNAIKDTVNWVLISGSFMAEGGEEYMTIGNFNDSTLKIVSNSSNLGNNFAYYYIDDVSVIEDTTTSIDNGQLAIDNGIRAYPNPVVNGEVTFTYTPYGRTSTTTGDTKSISMFNIDGQEVARYQLVQGSSVLHVKLPKLASGIYLARLAMENGSTSVKFVVE